MDYHGEVYLNMSLSQVLEKEGVEQEFVLEVKRGASRRIIDASKEFAPFTQIFAALFALPTTRS